MNRNRNILNNSSPLHCSLTLSYSYPSVHCEGQMTYYTFFSPHMWKTQKKESQTMNLKQTFPHLPSRTRAPPPPEREHVWKPHKGKRRSPACRPNVRAALQRDAQWSRMEMRVQDHFSLDNPTCLIPVITSLMALLNESQHLPLLAWCLCWQNSS